MRTEIETGNERGKGTETETEAGLTWVVAHTLQYGETTADPTTMTGDRSIGIVGVIIQDTMTEGMPLNTATRAAVDIVSFLLVYFLHCTLFNLYFFSTTASS